MSKLAPYHKGIKDKKRMEFIGYYAKYGLTPYRYDMLVITKIESASGGRQTLRDR